MSVFAKRTFGQLHVRYLMAFSASSSICLPTVMLWSLLSSISIRLGFSGLPSSTSSLASLLLLLSLWALPFEPKRPIAILHSGWTSYKEYRKDDDEKPFPGALTTGFGIDPEGDKREDDRTDEAVAV
jgi:hypothetical protein